VTLTPKGEKCVDKLARLHRRELQSLQDQFAVPDLSAGGDKERAQKRARGAGRKTRRATAG